MITTANLGFPRMGRERELKWALERHWRGELDAPGLAAVARELRLRHWRLQAERGIDRIPSGDASLYDHVLDAAVTVGAVAPRFGSPFDVSRCAPDALARYFTMARGAEGVAPLALTKWFDTNYHHLVPELAPDQEFAYVSPTTREHFVEARAAGFVTRPVLLGPVTFLRLARRTDGGPTIDLLDALLPAYEAHVADLVAHGAVQLQFDEPVLATDLDQRAHAALAETYERLRRVAGAAEITVACPFGALGANLAPAAALPIDLLHVDLVRAPDQLGAVLDAVPARLGVSLGVIDGRNIWRADLRTAVAQVEHAVRRLGTGRVHIAPSCSLLHLPIDVEAEPSATDAEVRSWLAFAVQRLDEVRTVAEALDGAAGARQAVEVSAARHAARLASPRVQRAEVRRRVAAIGPADTTRSSAYADRVAIQRARLRLPGLPTTTIGSFPQTADVRRARAEHRRGALDEHAYDRAIAAEIERCVRVQEDVGLDVLVHGEFERTDMVEYFGEQLDGFATTAQGWVQSYGSRCVKPPVLYGDVARPAPMTTRWSRYAAGLTARPMKAMLTGPVTILQWSFVRDDQPEAETARQVALALRDEVRDLEAEGLAVIQIDEPALREGLPLRAADHAGYLAWATEAFRIASSGVRDETQIHTHMCYAEFGPILDAVIALDADVISLEASRAGAAVVGELQAAGYPNEVGPGVWDIHSPRVPQAGELDRAIAAAIDALGRDRVWVNPDCGLKTRGWPEVEASLAAMVAATRRARAAG